jgi:hypothetical protein
MRKSNHSDKTRGARQRRALRLVPAALLTISGGASAQTAQPVSEPLVLVDASGLRLKARVEAMASTFAYSGTFFGLSSLQRGSRFDTSRRWLEGWLEPGLDASYRIHEGFQLYGALSLGVSGTLGADSFDNRNRYAARMENAFAGVRTTRPPESWNVDLSGGRQDYGIGTGMLIWQGGGNGGERGGGSIVQRTAWANTAIARVSFGGLGAEAFWLDPDELRSANTDTRLGGGLLQYKWGQRSRVGAAWIKVLDSRAPVPVANAPLLIANGRDGLESWHGYATAEGTAIGLPQLTLRGEFAIQRNSRIDQRAEAWYGEASHRFVTLPLMPLVGYGYGRFSGDDRRTARVERFDSLYYGNGLDNYWFGANGSYTFLNTNVRYHRATLGLVASSQDFLKLQYVHTRADQLRSPIQFGQAARAEFGDGGFTIASGVTKAHLADEVYAEWAHVWTPQISTALWAAYALPGSGLKSIPGARTEPWAATGVLLTVRF